MTEHTDIAGVERRLRDVPGFLAFEVRRYHELTDVDPSEDFDLPPEALTALGICRRPRPEAYAADTHAIAARVGVSTAGLANFLRGVDAVTALTQRPASLTRACPDGSVGRSSGSGGSHISPAASRVISTCPC
jgi:hypothetical protein